MRTHAPRARKPPTTPDALTAAAGGLRRAAAGTPGGRPRPRPEPLCPIPCGAPCPPPSRRQPPRPAPVPHHLSLTVRPAGTPTAPRPRDPARPDRENTPKTRKAAAPTR
ncbi:hypothetical protein GCM10027168_43690 [Streptomyces capparidis]